MIDDMMKKEGWTRSHALSILFSFYHNALYSQNTKQIESF
jgi:hypothetical protein